MRIVRRKFSNHLLDELDELIRGGGAEAAGRVLRGVGLREVPRAQYTRLAQLARRAGLPRLALRLLNPIVRPEKGSLVRAASEAERAEYAACLARVGAVPEAVRILREISSAAVPEALLFHAHALFAQWKYGEAVPLLRRYLARPLEAYPGLIAQVNLASALIFLEQFDEAERLVAGAIERARALRASRLLGNALELRAQVFIGRHEPARARQPLLEAIEFLKASGTLDSFFARKWFAVCDFLEKRPGALEDLARVRSEAESRQHWESVRDIDYRVAIRADSAEGLVHLYFGTPFTDYRAGLVRDLGPARPLPARYDWFPADGGAGAGARPPHVLDLSTGCEPGSRRAPLKPGALPFALVRALSADFYCALRPAALFSALFPGEYFNPASSLHKVHNLVLRTREELREGEVPLSIEQRHGAYRLRAKSGYGLRVSAEPIEAEAAAPADFALERLREAFAAGAAPFSAEAAAKVLEISGRSARRVLAAAVEQGEIAKSGGFRACRYGFRRAA